MTFSIRVLLTFALIAPVGSFASAQPISRAENIKRIKSATVFVQIGERGTGTAFCVHELGFFLTNEHVVRNVADVALVLNPGLAAQKVLAARVVRRDAAADLALLKVDAKVSCASLPLGSSDGLAEQADLIAAGFPFGKDLALEHGEYPSISINGGKITSLRLKNGELERIQMDAVVNPGNSGGPVVDDMGRVVGVVVSGVRGATVNFAIPVNHVHRFVSTPEIEFLAPSVAYVDRFKAVAFQVKTTTILPNQAAFQVELVLGLGDAEERTIAMKLEKNHYRAVAEPLSKTKGAAMLKASLSYPTGNLSGIVADRTFKVSGDEIALASVRSIRFGPEATILLTSDKSIKGPITGLDELELQLGGETIKLNPTKAAELAIAPRELDDRVAFAIIVRSGDKVVARLRDTLAFRDTPGVIAAKTPVVPGNQVQKLDGFWVVEQSESKGNLAWPRSPEEALYFEGNKLIWAKKDGTSPAGAFEADIEYVTGKNPQQVALLLNRGPGSGQKWQVIYKIEGNILTIATNCDEDRCPTVFTIRATPGSAQYVRTYRRVME